MNIFFWKKDYLWYIRLFTRKNTFEFSFKRLEQLDINLQQYLRLSTCYFVNIAVFSLTFLLFTVILNKKVVSMGGSVYGIPHK